MDNRFFMTLLCLLVISTILPLTLSLKVGILPMTGGSHTLSMDTITQQIIKRGHEVNHCHYRIANLCCNTLWIMIQLQVTTSTTYRVHPVCDTIWCYFLVLTQYHVLGTMFKYYFKHNLIAELRTNLNHR